MTTQPAITNNDDLAKLIQNLETTVESRFDNIDHQLDVIDVKIDNLIVASNQMTETQVALTDELRSRINDNAAAVLKLQNQS